MNQIVASAETGAEMIELHTGCFANAVGRRVADETARLTEAAHAGRGAGLQVNAGHGINYQNIVQILSVPYLTELNIGHTIVARAMRIGLEAAVREMKLAMSNYQL